MQQRETMVEVWGKREPVTLYQQSKSVWVATGEYLGHHIEVKGRTAGAAAKLWAEIARYRTN